MALQKKNKKRTIFYVLSLIAVYILAFLSIFPPIQVASNFNSICATFSILWIITTFIDSPSYLLKKSKYLWAVYFFTLYTFCFPYITGNLVIGNRFFELFQLPLFHIAYLKNKDFGREKDSQLLIKLLIPVVLIISLWTFQALIKDPWASREISKHYSDKTISENTVGGYYFIYFLVINIGILLFNFFHKQISLTIFQKILYIVLISSSFIIIVLSNYTIALSLSLLSILFLFLRPLIQKNNLKSIIFNFLLLTIFLAVLLWVGIHYMEELFGSSSNAIKIIEMQNYFSANDAGDSMLTRVDTYSESIDSFINNPFFGLIGSGAILSKGSLSGIGQHSQILDTFALFGIGIGLLQLFIYLYPITSRIRNENGTISTLSILMLLIFFILVTINNASASIGFAIFFIYPTINDFLQKKIILP